MTGVENAEHENSAQIAGIENARYENTGKRHYGTPKHQHNLHSKKILQL